MALSKWRLKHLGMAPFERTAAGAGLYEWLTAVGLGTQSGMSAKWCYWFREHVVLCRRSGGASFADGRIWLFEPGWSLAPVVARAEVLESTHGQAEVGRPARDRLEGAQIAHQ